MLLARVHPLEQVFTLYPSGQLGYVGQIVNLEQKSVEFLEAIPPPPEELPILLIRRMTREPFAKRARRQPFVANYARLKNALDWLLERHAQYNGVARPSPSVGNSGKFYALDAAGEVALEAQERLAAEGAGPDVDLPHFSRWLGNETFAVAGKVAEWLRTEGAARHRGASEWDALRREIKRGRNGIRLPGGGRRPERFARGAACLPASWVEISAQRVGLLPDSATGGGGSAGLGDELLAAKVEAAMEAPFVYCDAAPSDEAGDSAKAFLQDVVDKIPGCAVGPGGGGGAPDGADSSDAYGEHDPPPDFGGWGESPLRAGAGQPTRAGPPSFVGRERTPGRGACRGRHASESATGKPP